MFTSMQIRVRVVFCTVFSVTWLSEAIASQDMTREQEIDSMGRNFTQLYKHNLEQLVRIINYKTEACDDFYAHACGNYIRLMESDNDENENKNGSNEDNEDNAVPPFLYNKEDRMHFFDEKHLHFGTRPGKILAQLYTDCKSRNEQHILSKTPPLTHWERMLEELDFLAQDVTLYQGWPYLRYQWARWRRHYDLNWITLAAQFAAHGLPILLNIYFAEKTIFIAPVENMLCPSLKTFKLSLMPLLEGRNSQVAHIIGHELRSFCRSLHGELPSSASGINLSPNDSNVLIDNNTVEYFQHFFSLLNFTEAEVENARKLPIDVERSTTILEVLRQTEPRIIFNYILWHAHESLKYDDCYLLTEEFERLLFSEYWHWDVFEACYRRDVAMAMYLYHTTRFQKQRKETLMGADWYKFLLAPLERKDFNIARIIQSHANDYFNVQQLSTIYDAVKLKPNAFYANLLHMRKCQLRESFVTPYIDNEDLNHPAYFFRQFLEFCVLTLKEPIFHYYATQDLDLWQNSNLQYDTDGYYTALDCLERQSLQYITHGYDDDDDDDTIFRILDSFEIDQVLRLYRAFMEAHNDYNFWLEGESFSFAEDFILQYFNLDSKRILFYAVTQLYCNRNDYLYKALINRSFMNMPIFHDAFNCSNDDGKHMNPTTQCRMDKCT